MNIIINGFNGKFLPVIHHLFNQLPIEYCSVINVDIIEFPEKISGQCHDYESSKLGIYKVDWNLIYPLDRELIGKMVSCETTVLKMIERLGPGGIDVEQYDTRKKMYLRHLRYWNHIIKTKKINFVIFSTIPHVAYDYVIYSLCKLYGIPTLMMYRMPILPFKNVLLYQLDDIKKPAIEVIKRYEEKLKSIDGIDLSSIPISESTLSYFHAHSSKINYPKAYTNPGQKEEAVQVVDKIKSKVKNALSAIKMLLDKQYYLFYYWIKLKLDKKYIRKFYDKYVTPPDLSVKYVYLALHYQPECTTSPMAGVFVDQLLIIQLISYLLPDDVYLYVKEHPRDSLVLDREFYEEILNAKNVKLVPRHLNNYKLIDNSVAVATATGTAGWEALIRGKPVLMFGYYFYQYAPGVFHINTVDDCKKALNEILNGDKIFFSERLKIFLDAMKDISFNGYVDFRYGDVATISDQENIINISNALVNKIRVMASHDPL